jgi:phage shock protein E
MNHPMNWTTLLIFLAVLAAFFIFRQMSQVSSDAAKQYLRKGAVVIDVRGPDEYASGHLPGTVNVPLGELSGRISKVSSDKNHVILLHCQSGGRSGMAAGTLKSLGYTNAYNLGSYSRAKGILSGAQDK